MSLGAVGAPERLSLERSWAEPRSPILGPREGKAQGCLGETRKALGTGADMGV